MNDKPQRYAIVGMKNYPGAERLVATAPPDEPVTLVREPNNRFDANAVAVWMRGQKVGFVPKTQNAVLARFIDQFGETVTDLMKKTRQSPFVTIAMDAAGAVDIVSNKAADGRLHLGSNTYPLVELV